MKYTGIVILNYNNYEDTVNCVESALKYNSAPVKYIVVDNGSTREGAVGAIDGCLRRHFAGDYLFLSDGASASGQAGAGPLQGGNDGASASVLPGATFLASGSNDGYARGNNKGLELAYRDPEIDHVLILNNDILFVEDMLPQLLEFLAGHPEAGIVSPMLLKKDGVTPDWQCARLHKSGALILWSKMPRIFSGIRERLYEKTLVLARHPEYMSQDAVEIELPSGSCMLVGKELFMQIGGFDPHTFLYYEEDILFEKLRGAGRSSYVMPKTKCIHLGAGSTQRQSSYFLAKANYDSMLYYVQNYARVSALVKWLLKCLRGPVLMSYKSRG